MTEKIEEAKEVGIKDKIFTCFAYLLILYSLFFVFGLKPYVVFKAKNPDNLIQGCLYFYSYSSNFQPIGGISVDGFTAGARTVSIKEFPANKKCHLILQRNPERDTTQCHRVTYVKVFVGYTTFHFPYDFIDY